MAKNNKTLDTVNVVEYCDNQVIAVHAFKNDKDGQFEAEKMFRAVAKENDFNPSEIKEGLEEGMLSHSNGEYQVFLVTSQQ